MANDDYSRGFVPLNLTPLGVHYYRVSSAADIALGQPVALSGVGYAVAASVASLTYVLGVAVGFAGVNKQGLATNDPFLDVSDLTPPVPSSDTGDRWVAVADDPHQLFYIQEDTGGTALALADVGGALIAIWGNGVGNPDPDTGWARALELDASSIVTATGGLVQLVQLHDALNSDGTNNAVGDYAKWVVQFLTHQRGGTGNEPIV